MASQHELQFDPAILDGYDCVVCVGHDEYWTWEMRDAIDGYVDRGGRAARFAGNFMWQTRLEENGRRQVCYKYRARAEDPLYGTAGQARTSTSWEAPEVGRSRARRPSAWKRHPRPVCRLGRLRPRGARGFPIYRPEHWAFAGTGLYYGDVLGADAQIFGYEVDGVDYVIRNGLPEATGEGGAPEGMQILALGLSSLIEENADVPVGDRYLGDADGRFAAETLVGEPTDAAAIDRVKRGCGMIVNFRRGAGEVFHAGSCEWVAGLLRQDPMVARVTANVLDRYLQR